MIAAIAPLALTLIMKLLEFFLDKSKTNRKLLADFKDFKHRVEKELKAGTPHYDSVQEQRKRLDEKSD